MGQLYQDFHQSQSGASVFEQYSHVDDRRGDLSVGSGAVFLFDCEIEMENSAFD